MTREDWLNSWEFQRNFDGEAASVQQVGRAWMILNTSGVNIVHTKKGGAIGFNSEKDAKDVLDHLKALR